MTGFSHYFIQIWVNESVMSEFFIDLHCHPTIKPYGQSFKKNLVHSSNFRKKNSIWFQDRPGFFEKILNWTVQLTKFTQSDFRTLQKGNCHIISASLYPLERGFFDLTKLNLGTGLITDLLVNLVSGVSRDRINSIQSNNDYFADLEKEYRFLLERSGQKIKIKGQEYTYKVINSISEIDLQAPNTLYCIISIEGAHVFNCGYDPEGDPAANRPEEILDKVAKVKKWSHPPLLITFAHHFYNELTGHEKSFTGISQSLIGENQQLGLGEGITPLGYQVLEKLLDDQEGSRIYVDVKHMSVQARKEYYALLQSDPWRDKKIPIIVSHGAVNGQRNPEPSSRPTFPEKASLFKNEPINFYDEELIRIEESGGIFGIQLDERRIASQELLEETRSGRLGRKKIQRAWAGLIWNQIQHIAEVLNQANLPAWNMICLGSDFDGIIDPLSGYWDASSYPALQENLLFYAQQYMSAANPMQNINQIQAEAIIRKFFSENAWSFLERYFNPKNQNLG